MTLIEEQKGSAEQADIQAGARTGPGANGYGSRQSRCLILLCRDALRGNASEIIDSLAMGLSDRYPGLFVVSVADLCSRLREIRSRVAEARPERLILGLCSDDNPVAEIQAHARRGGIDPLGVQVIDISPVADGAGELASPLPRLMALMSGALARAAAFGGSSAANSRAVFIPGDQKVSRRSMFTLPPISYLTAPTIDLDACRAADGCDLCAAACPHGAIGASGGVITVDRRACQSCGICVAACPQRAVEFPGFSAEEIEADLASALERSPASGEARVEFVCQKSHATKRSSGKDGYIPIKVACAGMVPVSAMLRAISGGATEVSVASCGRECGNGAARVISSRVDYCRALLRQMGDDPERVRLNPDPEAPAPAPAESPPSVASGRDVRAYGAGMAAQVVLELGDVARSRGVEGLRISHEGSPLALVAIDQAACTVCGTCAKACPTGALRFDESDIRSILSFEPGLCTGCRKCVEQCPEKAQSAIRVSPVTDLAAIGAGQVEAAAADSLLCEECGVCVTSVAVIERLQEMLGDEFDARRIARLCNQCRSVTISSRLA